MRLKNVLESKGYMMIVVLLNLIIAVADYIFAFYLTINANYTPAILITLFGMFHMLLVIAVILAGDNTKGGKDGKKI